MASWNQYPEIGQKFWEEGIGSGKITHVSFPPDNDLIVDFYEKGVKTYELDEVLGNWTEDYGGTWMIHKI